MGKIFCRQVVEGQDFRKNSPCSGTVLSQKKTFACQIPQAGNRLLKNMFAGGNADKGFLLENSCSVKIFPKIPLNNSKIKSSFPKARKKCLSIAVADMDLPLWMGF